MANARARPREAAKQETREALVRAGMALFSEEGVDVPSLDSICARAGFTRGAFYVHFKDREDFLGAVVDQTLSDFVNWVISTGDLQGGGLFGIIERFLGVAKDGRLPFSERQRLLLQLVSRGSGEKRYKPIIDEAVARLSEAARLEQQAGRLDSPLDAREIGLLLTASAVGFMAVLDAGFEANFAEIQQLIRRLLLGRER
jgi:TetR/AcrR family transcriptional repressor of nem operon